ncbi:hypothetical protein FZO89_15485 [Luteimonas viscosa]|uniref:Cytochrome C n=1 Tax=Luteimonas viscosa TaxID=1132694 RepID=A0A5D4XLU4_9GAMM|nr:hypothetical protein [Luteimonas viscosa]TYT23640.1 hypothetical protein FZO89_15485 [Luteimonas viscosa]
MSTTPPPASGSSPVRKPPSAASKYLFVFLLGLVIGIVAVVMLLRSLEARKTWRDHYPDALMHLLSAQAAQMRDNATANRCSPTDTLPHLQALRSLGNDFERAFPDLRDDQRFVNHAAQFRGELDAALSSPPVGCEGVTRAADQVGEACKACHQDFR